MSKRLLYKAHGKLAASNRAHDYGPDISLSDEDDATLVGSLTGRYTRDGAMHLPAIDIDFPCELVESSTPGHFHLYIDKEVTQEQYKIVLQALHNAGIVQRGFYDSFLRRGQTFLRRPGVKKADT